MQHKLCIFSQCMLLCWIKSTCRTAVVFCVLFCLWLSDGRKDIVAKSLDAKRCAIRRNCRCSFDPLHVCVACHLLIYDSGLFLFAQTQHRHHNLTRTLVVKSDESHQIDQAHATQQQIPGVQCAIVQRQHQLWCWLLWRWRFTRKRRRDVRAGGHTIMQLVLRLAIVGAGCVDNGRHNSLHDCDSLSENVIGIPVNLKRTRVCRITARTCSLRRVNTRSGEEWFQHQLCTKA